MVYLRKVWKSMSIEGVVGCDMVWQCSWWLAAPLALTDGTATNEAIHSSVPGMALYCARLGYGVHGKG